MSKPHEKIPNYTMFRLMVIEAHNVKVREPEAERMPKGYICPGFDIRLMQPLAVLKYLCGVTTQWSCQGNHSDETCDAYILLPAGVEFPADLTSLLAKSGFIIDQVADYDYDGTNIIANGKMRWKLSASWKTAEGEALYLLNEKLLGLLDSWSHAKIVEHLPYMKDPYYSDVVELYGAAKVS